MGIPCYFSSIIRKYNNILTQMTLYNKKIDNLYLDSNSIIYDAIPKCDITQLNFEEQLGKEVIFQLEQHILDINPQKKIIIAFDGVAPYAKIQQQRERRFKSNLERNIKKNILKSEEMWDTCNITPGTDFMNNLMNVITRHFSKKTNVLVYSSEHAGEGEHKIFEYIRNNPDIHKNETTVIYGLDADLIMLCISHNHLCKNLYLYRETPHFIRSIQSSLVPNETYLLDISLLIQHIQQDVDNMLDDYIFVCFMLGNDFLPHFPALNIRTTGVDTLIDTYKQVFKRGDNNLVGKNKKINWSNLRKFVLKLSEKETKQIQNEYIIRDKWEDRRIPTKTPIDKMNLFTNIPVRNRDIENIIDPFAPKWRDRYYDVLMDIHHTKENIKKICINYLEGLEWTYKYYTQECYDWKWKYNYSYPPLLSDLAINIPIFNTEYIALKEKQPLDPRLQLCMVLPKTSFDTLVSYDKVTKQKLEKILFYDDVRYEWSFCKYFWECHVHFPYLDINQLVSIV
jgi:5'-3' exonuclease